MAMSVEEMRTSLESVKELAELNRRDHIRCIAALHVAESELRKTPEGRALVRRCDGMIAGLRDEDVDEIMTEVRDPFKNLAERVAEVLAKRP